MDFNLCGGNEKEIDNEISFKIKRDENLIINTINKNDGNKIENNEIINKKETIEEDKGRNNKNKNISKNEIKEVDNMENKKIKKNKNKATNKNEYVNNKINNNNNFDFKNNEIKDESLLYIQSLFEEKRIFIEEITGKALKILEENNKKEFDKLYSPNYFLVLEKINIFNSILTL
jgi:hypothetical protein